MPAVCVRIVENFYFQLSSSLQLNEISFGTTCITVNAKIINDVQTVLSEQDL